MCQTNDEMSYVIANRFTEDEVLKLHDLYADYGANWKVIGMFMKRSGPACRDKWRVTHQELGSSVISVVS